MRTEPCACGGIIVSSSKEGIAMAVREHVASLGHLVWRYSREGPTATSRWRDMSVSAPVRPALPALPLGEVPGG